MLFVVRHRHSDPQGILDRRQHIQTARLAMKVDHQLLCNFLAASEQRRTEMAFLEDFVDDPAVAMHKVHISQRHTTVLQQPHEVLSNNGHPACAAREVTQSIPEKPYTSEAYHSFAKQAEHT